MPVVLTIAGSDCSGGAGIQADLKTLSALGVYGASAVTCVVAEHPGRVLNITPIAPARVADQIRLVLEAFPVAAIKTGLLCSAEIIEAVAHSLQHVLAQGVPLVVDPVLVASSGKMLLKKSALPALKNLIAQATLVTPNRDEASLLVGKPITNLADLRLAAVELAVKFGQPSILVKGGHLRGGRSVDVLASPEGRKSEYAAKRIPGVDPHGTGCTYSAAIAAGLAQGSSLPEAIAMGKKFVTRAITARLKIGSYEMLNHLRQV